MNLIEAIPLNYPDFKFWYLNNDNNEAKKMRPPYGGICGILNIEEKCKHPEIINCHNCEQYLSPEDMTAFLDMTHKHGPINWELEFDKNGELKGVYHG